MALTSIVLYDREQERSVVHYTHDASDGTAVVYTGPHIAGAVVTADGVEYDVSNEVIEVQAGHEGEVGHLIGKRFEAEGHPLLAGQPFVHDCSDACGPSRG